jgi:hypothetical protein
MTHLKSNNEKNAIEYIVQAFNNYNIIGLGEGEHHLKDSHIFFHKMLDNKKIQEIIDVIIVEFANVAYQDILDKYIFGEEVDIKELRKIWRESTQSIGRFGEALIYFELLKKIRDVNAALPKNKKIRVVGGDPFIDWQSIKTREDYLKIIAARDTLPAELAIDYGIKQSKKVLLIYSEFHFVKINDKRFHSEHHTITTVVNSKYPGAMKVIAIFNPSALHIEALTKNLPLYSIIDLESSEFGNLPAENYFKNIQSGNEAILFEGYKIKNLFDVFLYIGPSESWKRVDFPKAVFSDNEWSELNRRLKIVGLDQLDDKLRF